MGTILQKLEKVKDTKEAVRQAIVGKGQAVADTAPFDSYPEKIAAIQTGVQLPELANPGSAADLLAGKQLVDQYGNPLTGTMPQKSTADLTASGASIIVPAGYYPSQVSKSVATATHPKPTISRSGGTVTVNHVQSAGYTSGGTTSETLTIPTKAGTTITPGTSRKTAVSSGYLTTGAVYVAGDANLKAENIKSGVSIFGVSGNLKQQGKIHIYWSVTPSGGNFTLRYNDPNMTEKTAVLTPTASSVDIEVPLNGWVIISSENSFGMSFHNTNNIFSEFTYSNTAVVVLRGDYGQLGLYR